MTPQAAATIFKVLGTDRRTTLLRFLLSATEPVTLTMIEAHLGIGSGPASLNVTALSEVGLIRKQPSGRHLFVQVNRSMIEELVTFLNGEKHV